MFKSSSDLIKSFIYFLRCFTNILHVALIANYQIDKIGATTVDVSSSRRKNTITKSFVC